MLARRRLHCSDIVLTKNSMMIATRAGWNRRVFCGHPKDPQALMRPFV
jgi:hypothetical protein